MGLLTWSGPAPMLFARPVFSVLAQGLVAGVYALRSSPTPWLAAARWLPVYATLIDVGCLAMLWALTRREGIRLFDLISFDRRRWRGDVLLGLGLVPVSLLFIFGGITISSVLVYGTTHAPDIFRPLPLLPALYAVLVFPLVWAVTEQMTYNGYLLPRIQVLCGSIIAVALVSFPWSLQHAFQPLTFDPDFMLYRFLAPIPHSVFDTVLYLRVRRLLPFIIAHWLMDGGDAFVTLLLPHLR
ncbi:MAG TPA: CPBP family intramembrane glutamic endopeptidase [Longimicrobiales bacterium]|nr:CPBP family intramembrane glutamic endopeptidase [Longimicrobiales bacterium]